MFEVFKVLVEHHVNINKKDKKMNIINTNLII